MPRSPRGHYLKALEIMSIVRCPSIIKYRKAPASPIKVDFSNKLLEYAIDILLTAERCDMSKWMIPYLEGARWESIPGPLQGKVSANLRTFRQELREGGYSVE
ncbi:MAG: hypothetical protein A2W25_13905 [candidate division Zixibacteria bacterium RBG_16_53_22]|nr:MAG: hypothetical protein A2W25_13905 [candidate division Zixibacteria bacterium RBG_16_53_22]